MTDQIKYTTIKIPLRYIIRDKKCQNVLQEAAGRVNRLTIYLYQLLRLWALERYEKTSRVPLITTDTVKMAYRSLQDTSNCRGPKPKGANKIALQAFETLYNSLHKELRWKKSNGKNLMSIIGYTSTDILTNIENNIRCHFPAYLNRYVNRCFPVTGRTRDERKAARQELAALKKSLMTGKLTCDPKYNEWIARNEPLILPTMTEESHYLGCKTDPQKYLPGMFYMNRELERNGLKTFQPFPLRRELIPKYVPIDTHALINLMDLEGKGALFSNLFEKRAQIWNRFFKMDHEVFNNKRLVFDYRISTDGLTASLQFVNPEGDKIKTDIKSKMKAGRELSQKIKNGELPPETKKKAEKPSKKPQTNTKTNDEWQYLEELDDTELQKLRTKGFVVADPGRNNLLYLMNSDGKRLRFTAKERNHVIRKREMDCQLVKLRKKLKILEIEQGLQETSGKSCDLETFKKYVRIRNETNDRLGSLYDEPQFRKLKWYGYVNREKYFLGVVAAIRKKFKDQTIIYGDYEAKRHLKGKAPVPGIGLKRRISQQIKVVNVDEFRTSALSFLGEEYCGKLEVKDENGKSRSIHSVLTFKTENGSDGCIGRDLNAVRNMKKIVASELAGLGRPNNFRRGQEVVPKEFGRP